MQEMPIRSYAFIGDAVYEVFAREKTVKITTDPAKLHKANSSIVNAAFHADILEFIRDFLNETEADIVRRARNLSVTTARRTNQKIHRLSTAFEALVGYLYLNNPERLKELNKYLEPFIEERLSNF
jgi:ribonuclease-3 family protein